MTAPGDPRVRKPQVPVEERQIQGGGFADMVDDTVAVAVATVMSNLLSFCSSTFSCTVCRRRSFFACVFMDYHDVCLYLFCLLGSMSSFDRRVSAKPEPGQASELHSS